MESCRIPEELVPTLRAAMVGDESIANLKKHSKLYLTRRISIQADLGDSVTLQKEQLQKIDRWIDGENVDAVVKITW